MGTEMAEEETSTTSDSDNQGISQTINRYTI